MIFALVLPFFYDSGSGFIEDCTTALVYVVMALGLNIVVGFAGLLDLGYVAFFAIGAYTMGWLASGFFNSANIHIGVAEQLSSQPGIHINWLIVVFVAAVVTAGAGARARAFRRCGCAATTSPSSRSRSGRSSAASRSTRTRASSGSATSTSPTAGRGSRRWTGSTSRSSTASRRST